MILFLTHFSVPAPPQSAKQLKRNFIGIEINEKYCKIAQDRLKQELLF